MTSQRTNIAFLLVALGTSLVVGYGIVRPFLRPLVFALIIGIGFFPLHIRISRRVPRRSLAALLSTLAVLVIFVVPAIVVASATSRDLIHAAQQMAAKSAEDGGVFVYVTGLLERSVDWVEKYVDLEKSGLKTTLATLPAKASGFLLAAATSLIAGIATFAGEAIITFFVLFFVFRDGPSATNQIASLLPLGRDRIDRLFRGVQESVIANLYGILVVAVAQGLLTGIAMLIVGARSPLLLGTAAGVFSLVPLVGSSLVWLPVAIVFLITGHVWKGVFLLAWGVAVVGTADNIIRPMVVMGRVNFHPLLLLFALIGGVQQFGFIGLFIGPVVISVIFALIDMLRDEIEESKRETAVSAPVS